ncbi:MarR family winged helix-turn-helix transcriptional regulator [Nonomuraea sediminis]|uniref:MarR family winged helix-turn-helix transcriptional regulator n=1 Tax=Nonomuraea sediminis TaxID=2835864 RepID=UPI001BDD779E|nr:MarR family transcriptional regulator [Nonomuraea sediminis]
MANPKRLGELIQAASRRFAQQGLARFAAHGLSPSRVRLLTLVSETPGMRMVEAAQALGVSQRAVTALVDALESEGLARRRPDPSDRRALRLELTAAGREALATIGDLQEQVSSDIFAGLSSADQSELERLLVAFLEGESR